MYFQGVLNIFCLSCILWAIVCVCEGQNDAFYFTTIAFGEGLLFESPQWAPEENALYWVDSFQQKLYRWDQETDEITSRRIGYGFIGFITPIQGYPGVVLISVRTELYILKWNSPKNDTSLRILTGVDFGKPDNMINDGKVDANGNIWFGTFGKLISLSPNVVVPDQGTMYTVNYNNFKNPAIKKRPVILSNGIAWSSDNKIMYYNDSGTRKVAKFDFDLEKSEIANMTILFDFDDYNIAGIPDGMTIDNEGNLYVATFDGGQILKIDSASGKLLDIIDIPADLVSSVIWGGPDCSTLFVTTGKLQSGNPKFLSGSILAIENLGPLGRRETLFKFPNADQY